MEKAGEKPDAAGVNVLPSPLRGGLRGVSKPWLDERVSRGKNTGHKQTTEVFETPAVF